MAKRPLRGGINSSPSRVDISQTDVLNEPAINSADAETVVDVPRVRWPASTPQESAAPASTPTPVQPEGTTTEAAIKPSTAANVWAGVLSDETQKITNMAGWATVLGVCALLMVCTWVYELNFAVVCFSWLVVLILGVPLKNAVTHSLNSALSVRLWVKFVAVFGLIALLMASAGEMRIYVIVAGLIGCLLRFLALDVEAEKKPVETAKDQLAVIELQVTQATPPAS